LHFHPFEIFGWEKRRVPYFLFWIIWCLCVAIVIAIAIAIAVLAIANVAILTA
jgi:hypothetical protein